MCRPNGTPAWIQIRRLTLLTIGLAPVVLFFLIAVLWLQSRISPWFYWKTGLIFLITLEVAYGVTVVLTILGAVVLGFLFHRARRVAASRSAVGRGLLLCVSILLGLIAAETASAVRLHRSHRGTALPVGGLTRETRFKGVSRLAFPPRDIELPTTFPEARENGEINLVIVGESSAEGVPYTYWVSIGRIIAWQLKEAIPDRPVRVEVLAGSGATLEQQHQRLSWLRRRPDVLIIYCGHNEFSTRFDASRDLDHYFDQQLPTRWTLFVDRLRELSPLCSLIRETAERCRIAIPPPIHGNRALVDVPAYSRLEYATLLVDFRRRLEAIVSYAAQIGATPILIVPPANDAGFEPNRSFLPPTTARGEREAFRRDFLAARRLEATDPERSLEQYRALLARQPGFAETHFRLAQLRERAGDWDEAYRHYVLARDLDGFPMRLPTAFQDVYREVASRHRSILIDGQSYFHAIGPHGLLDDHLFHDGMHPSLRGQIALAQAILQALHSRGAFDLPEDAAVPVIDPARCAAHFGLVPGSWRYICLWGIMFYDLTSPIRYDSSQRLQKKRAFATAADRIEAGDAPESVGLPNVGVPAPVPIIPIVDTGPNDPSAPAVPAVPKGTLRSSGGHRRE